MNHSKTISAIAATKALLLGAASIPVLAGDYYASYSGAVSAFGQMASDIRVDDGLIGVLDIEFLVPTNGGEWLVYIEATSSSLDNTVSAIYNEALADAGGAVDENGEGRIQISSLQYTIPLGSGDLTMGLIHPSSFIEPSELANNETTQFISSSFVNIPTIDAPDYTLGLGYSLETPGNWPNLTFLFSRSSGLADNNGSYSKLYSGGGQGVFVSSESWWPMDVGNLRLGLWRNTGKLDELESDATDKGNWGLNLSFDTSVVGGLASLRYGWADPSVSEAEYFIGLSYQISAGQLTTGLGYGYTALSDDVKAPGRDDFQHAETYIKWNFYPQWHGTASLQWLENSGFDSSGETSKAEVWIFTLRVVKEIYQ